MFGAGPRDATIMFVGEQPGDVEDRAGEPFVGPAGRLLRESLAEAGIDAETVYLTNAVKHFKWRERGKRRIHERPNREEVLACRLWLDSEIAIVKPRVLVALGATAASVILPKAKVMRDRAKPFTSPLADIVTVTVHPRRSCARLIRNRGRRRGGSSSRTSGKSREWRASRGIVSGCAVSRLRICFLHQPRNFQVSRRCFLDYTSCVLQLLTLRRK